MHNFCYKFELTTGRQQKKTQESPKLPSFIEVNKIKINNS